MKATLTSKGQITLPIELRRRFDLKPGDVLGFDETASFIKARTPFDREAMNSVIGRGKYRSPKRSSDDWIYHFRGPVELPRSPS